MNKNRKIRRIGAMLLAVMTALTFAVSASAATVPDATIDTTRTGSIDIYKYDLSRANTDDSVKTILDSYVSTGIRDASLEAVMDDGTENDLGNGQMSYGYAIKGVEFSYLKVADIVTYDETEADGTHKDMVLYKMEEASAADLLSAIGLTINDAYAVTEDYAVAGYHFFESDTLVNALKTALESNSTAVKNALETYMAAQNAQKFDETDEHGHTMKSDLPLGLYLIVETKVPEMVTYTTDPFLVSVPMTSVNGTNADNGGEEWIYDITLYPKNETGIPSLEKTAREAMKDTGKNDGSDAIDDGYEHNATASDGDVVEYQIISKLPTITSEATALTDYTFVDTLSRGIAYNANSYEDVVSRTNYDPEDVVIEWFRDEACTDKIATWRLSDSTPKYTVSFEPPSFVHSPTLPALTNDATRMTVAMTNAGLDEINHGTAARGDASNVELGYSSCYIRITYSATVNQDADVVYGDDGNPNTVILTWKRSNMDYWDTLVDDCHVYTYILDLTKEFSDDAGDYTRVNFKLFNETDGYWVTAFEADGGLYYVMGENQPAGHVAGTADEDGSKGTTFVPNATTGELLIYGLEDDEYIVTETQTDNGYTLLKDDIHVVITAADDADRPCGIYGSDVLGLLQNDPRYETFDGYQELAHNMLTASATVDRDEVTMEPDRGSEDAAVPLTVVNTKGFDLPRTGDNGVWQYSVFGVILMAAAAAVIIALVKTGKKKQKTK
ncbi:MAG: SpaH/EbpB family LPXTG-anchored major pilin [Oscillospiraceae bacterium]|nr:SpaH/EbpB family LPXTG-anchored major pilin [Oscillospiraceae bacterium]